ncbi:gamma carbonic anhydrase family protein [candidate division WOR-1 bacterium RIFCSPLOWO2_02_FULL_46_20]|uniref:Gamma carbonic anhydrase family protein n=2 Tax=Saganbacteria TaxID=1703751 RepID=A0A1F4R4J6_UNCSA|nr:MAG: gamma carbonic anhydrase family protein [candidate division WOR-1 bacterium RIFCSPHIGHO2_02_FULL_45_12]OGC03026.1 MAG: gamma carbonic anhydrase family protein [candidate division WOR-1 bacterium RIFCSPLOWO2_02_FULL_46_20]OGC09043.1 MAG: gamma carbonic anhydrase family protein [candidate division WOR-1 bacterium RIFCSPLOWO2_12_FULL_45_9]
MIGKYLKNKPRVHPSVFIAGGAQLIGAISIDAGSSVWFNAVIRADLNTIKIGKGVNIQDGCLLHLEDDRGILIEDEVTVGHGAILHACTIRKRALIGIGAVILNGAVVGAESVVGAGAVVTPGTRIPERSLVLGCPARVQRKLKISEIRKNKYWAQKYIKLAAEYLAL